MNAHNEQKAASKALQRIRTIASQAGTEQQHGPQFVAGMRRAANLLEKAIAATPAAPVTAAPADLIERCKEILAWQRTGVLPGDALRAYANARWPDEHDPLQIAEKETAREAFRILARAAAASTPAAPVLYGVPDEKGGVKLGKGWAFSKGPDKALGTTQPLFTEAPAAPGIDPDVLARDIHHAIADAGLAPLSPADNHTLRGVIRSVIDASPKGGSEAQPMFYIQDTRSFVGNCPMWWGPDGRGYVTRLDEAGRYTEEDAIRQNRARDTDIPWPCDEIDKLARPTVDFQHMRPRSERLAELAAQASDAEVRP